VWLACGDVGEESTDEASVSVSRERLDIREASESSAELPEETDAAEDEVETFRRL